MEENVTEQGFASAWNNNQGVLKEVMELRSAANASFIKGDLDNAFKCLESIYQTVSAILGESEISNLKDIQEKITQGKIAAPDLNKIKNPPSAKRTEGFGQTPRGTRVGLRCESA